MTDNTGFVVVCSASFSYKDTCNSMQGAVSELVRLFYLWCLTASSCVQCSVSASFVAIGGCRSALYYSMLAYPANAQGIADLLLAGFACGVLAEACN